MSELINLYMCLIIVIGCNIILGGLIGKLNYEFSFSKFFSGIFKGALIFVVIGAVYFLGVLNPDLIKVVINGVTVSFKDAITFVFMAAVSSYGYEIVNKLIILFKLDNIVVQKISIIDQEADKGVDNNFPDPIEED